MIRKAMTTLGLALLVSAQAVEAQAGHQHDQQAQDSTGMMGHGMMMGMMGAGEMEMGMTMMSGAPSPAMILRASNELALTAEQIARLEAMRTQSTEAIQPHMQQAMAAHQRALQALQGDSPDLSAYESAVREAANHMVVMHVAAARAGVEARAVLTTDQRARLTHTMTMMRRMTGGGSGGMMMQQGRGMQSGGMRPRNNR
ncbi:MAG: Spy/CpxP family protein refolding chaperone [Gemmatimonadaceae bacterium]